GDGSLAPNDGGNGDACCPVACTIVWMPVIALACCRLSGEALASDLYPNREQLAEALRGVGLGVVVVSGDDPDFDWA
ncbi:MAG: hypothetical protein FWC87_14150, partial [Acidimicrobiaceae bacterium]|nr:hypothetical protein [Acidimicrobiaceae bacterium]